MSRLGRPASQRLRLPLARKTDLGEGMGIVALGPATGRVKRTYETLDPCGPLVVTDGGVLVQNVPKELRLLR